MKNQHLNDRANFIKHWTINSEQLSSAAELVWNSDVTSFPGYNDEDKNKIHHMYRPAALLMGLSLETLIKACYIAHNPLVLGDTYPKYLSNHKLIKLSELIEFHPDDAETATLHRLTAAIEWVSKYPIPRMESGYEIDVLMRNDGDFSTFRQIYQKVLKKIPYPRT
jgi:hypothetical protein